MQTSSCLLRVWHYWSLLVGSAELTLLEEFYFFFHSPPPLLHLILIPSPLAPLQVLLMQESVRRIIEVEESKMGERTHTQAEDETEIFFS